MSSTTIISYNIFMRFFLKILPLLFFWGIFIFVIFRMPYPQTLIQANTVQLISFFVPLFLGITFTINLFLKNIYSSASLSFGLICLLTLKALDILNLVTALLTIAAVSLLVSYFWKMKRSSLTKLPKIPKLTHLGKQNVSS